MNFTFWSLGKGIENKALIIETGPNVQNKSLT